MWSATDQFVLDPMICPDKPVVEKAGGATTILAASFEANDRGSGIASDWYGARASQVFAPVEAAGGGRQARMP
jgi:hypothetical protein